MSSIEKHCFGDHLKWFFSLRLISRIIFHGAIRTSLTLPHLGDFTYSFWVRFFIFNYFSLLPFMVLPPVENLKISLPQSCGLEHTIALTFYSRDKNGFTSADFSRKQCLCLTIPKNSFQIIWIVIFIWFKIR